jgi:hypothetical protein
MVHQVGFVTRTLNNSLTVASGSVFDTTLILVRKPQGGCDRVGQNPYSTKHFYMSQW